MFGPLPTHMADYYDNEVSSASRAIREDRPHHPLFGRQFEEVGRTNRWGEERVWFRTRRNGALQTIPLQFTSLAAIDPYVHVGGGTNWHRVDPAVRSMKGPHVAEKRPRRRSKLSASSEGWRETG